MMPDEANAALRAPTRNNFFYGKLLTERDLRDEQTYFLARQRLLSRLGFGRGVLCGLELVVTADNTKVWIMPGTAIDGHGRVIVVPTAYCVENPAQPTDAYGKPAGDSISLPGTVTLCLHYHECQTEPVPVLVGECDTEQTCAPNRIAERYRIQILAGSPAELPAGLDDETCRDIFPRGEPQEDFNRRRAACRALPLACPPPDDECVTLGVVRVNEDGLLATDSCTYRTTLYSNQTLFDMLLCLADRVDACCTVRLLQYVSGDAQSAEPEAELPEPIVVRLVDGDGEPVPEHQVRFRIRGGGGGVVDDMVVTDADGLAANRWKLGPSPGLNTVEAAVKRGNTVLFHALGVAEEEEPPAEPPYVNALWPPPAVNLHPDSNNTAKWFERWMEQPLLELTFDREMRKEQLQDPELRRDWLRVWQVEDHGEIVVRYVEPVYDGVVDDPILGEEGFTIRYVLENVNLERPSRFIILMQPLNDNIVSAGNQPLLLDGEFGGTRLTAALMKRIWEIDDEQVFGQRDIWNRLVDTGATLPRSGDGDPGGRLHGWFGVLDELG